MGDAHGRLDAVLVALGNANFEPQTDRLISVGDLVDRGPNSFDLLKLTKQPWFYAVRGNHEAMFLDTNDHFSLVHWLINGGDWFLELDGEQILESYSLAAKLPVAITVDIKGGKKIGVCHAEWPGDDWDTIEEALTDQLQVNRMIWGRKILKNELAITDKTAALTIHGHTPIDAPKKLGSALFIDTGCVYGGKITLLEIKDALAWPASHGTEEN
jgi:serine/threonine protein phosphatase 1